MNAAVLTQLNSPLELMELELPDLDYGQVLVRVICSGICGAQLKEIRGEKGNEKYLPHLLGHEGFGIVEAKGIGVTKVKVGDRVIMHWRKGSGIESPIPAYLPAYHGDNRSVGGGRVTTFNELSVCSENRLTPVPFGTNVEFGALLGCGLSTALGVIENEAHLRFGESVLIIGCGGLGVNLILAAKMANAYPIHATDIIDKGTSAIEMGASVFHKKDAIMTDEVDVVIDTSGNPEAITRGINRLRPSGRFIMVGQPIRPIAISYPEALFRGDGQTIKATQGGGFMPDRDIPRYVNLHDKGLLKTDGIVTHRITLKDINTGLDLVRSGEASRVMVYCQ